MTTLDLLPDVETLVVQFLLDQTELTALVDTRIYTELPKTKTWPLVRVHQFGSLPARHPRWYETATVQIDGYGGPKRTARLIAETCAAALSGRLNGVYDEGVVTGVNITGFSDFPDDTFEPAQPRFLFVAQITVHP